MAKAKRGKSGSASDLVRWDSELMKVPYVEDDWKPFIVFMTPGKPTDLPVISLLSEIINTGIRKLFSVVEYQSLLEEVRELATSQGKSGKGKVPPTTTRPPQFLEVCEQAKTLMDQDEPISIPLLAKIVKFKLLMLKNKDLDRREVEKRLASKDSKQRVDSRSGSKQSARKSASPGKGKKGAKKEEPVPSPKKETQLKKRGEEGDDFQTIDDEPDELTDPQHYIIITGFTEAHLLSHLIDMKIAIDVIINMDTDYHLKLEEFVTADQTTAGSIERIDSIDADDMAIDHKDYQSKLSKFWEEIDTLIKNAPQGHHLHNVAKFDIFVDDNSLPNVSFDLLELEKRNQFSLWLFSKVADVCYDMLDYYQQYKAYLDNLKVIDVSAQSYLGSVPAASPDTLATSVETEQEGREGESVLVDVDPASVDMRYYKQLMSYIPMEIDSVPLILNSLLEQVVATTDGTHPTDQQPPKRADGLNHTLGNYLDKKLAFYGLGNTSNFWYNQPESEISPHIVYYGNESGFRLCKFGANDYLNPAEVEKNISSLHPFSSFKTYLQSSYDEIVDSTVRHQQFYNFCNGSYPICKKKFERAMRQYIFESLPSGKHEHAVEPDLFKDDGELGRALQKWDDFYFNLLHSGSSCAVVRESSGKLCGKSISQSLDDYCCVETFSPSVLLQVLDEARQLRPYLDTYYNHGNNTLLVVLQNPTNESLENNSEWSSWLHSDVGFRNYLEYVAVEIQDWIREQEMIEEERSKANIQEPEASVPVVAPPKEKSRWGMKTRKEMNQEEEKEDNNKRKKSGNRSRSPKKSASRSPQKKKSEKNVRRSASGKEGSMSTISKVSLTSEDAPLLPDPEKVCDFTGYNLNDDIIHVSGDLSYMFPHDGSIIKVERMQYIQKNEYIHMSVLKQNGDVFAIDFVNPDHNVAMLAKDVSNCDSNDINSGNIEDSNRQSSDDIDNNDGNNNDDQLENIDNNNNNNNIECEIGKSDYADDNDRHGDKFIDNNSIDGSDRPISNNSSVHFCNDVDKKDDNDNNVCTDPVMDTNATSEDGDSVAPFPSLPYIAENSCLYTNIRATFADGMVLVCSNSVNASTENTEQIYSDVSLENSQSAPTDSFQSKSAKPKGKKKDDDAKAQEDADKLKAIELENEEKLRQRIDDIKRLTKEQEATKNLYVTTSNGLHVSFMHHVDIKYSDTTICTESTFVVKLENFVNDVSGSAANGGVVSEVHRCIMEDGYVIQYLSDSTVRIISPNGDILHSTPFKKPHNAMVSYNEVIFDQSKSTTHHSSEQTKQGGRPSSMKSPKDGEGGSVPSKVVSFEDVDWHITYSNGKQIIKKCDGSQEDIRSLLISDAKCYETNEVLQTREDGVIMLRKPNGSTIVEYMDGTRITTYSPDDDGVGKRKCETSPPALDVVKIEHESMATVVANKSDMSISISFGNNKMVKGMKNGGYVVSKNGINEMVIDKNGNASVHPEHEVIISGNAIELPPVRKGMEKNACLLLQSNDECLYLTDNVGNKFTVNLLGEYNIEKKQQQQQKQQKQSAKPSSILPRYFVVHPDGKGEELLRYEDVVDYIKQAEGDPSSAVIRTVVEGDDDAEAVTVIKPHHGPPSKVWQKKKDVVDIVPVSMRERDFKLLPPVEQKTPGPPFGRRIVAPCKQTNKEIMCPGILELRHITQYKELTTEVREQIVKVISEYGEFVQQQQQMKEDLHNKELRNEEEIRIAANVRERYMKEKEECRDSNEIIEYESNIVDKYMEAITPPPPEPIPHARNQPERPQAEWEKDKIELEELHHAKTVIRNQIFPNYFDTEEGENFLKRNGPTSPDMDKLTDSLAFETRYPTQDLISSTPPQISQMSQLASMPDATSTPHRLDDSSIMSIQSSILSVQYNSSGNSSETTFNSGDGKHSSSRPINPTPLKSREHHQNTTQQHNTINECVDESKLEPINENSFNKSVEMKSDEKEMLRSRTHDVCGEVRKEPVHTPPSIRGSRPNALPNEKFARVEAPVRRQVNTASIGNISNMKDTSRLRGFVLIPDFVDFGVLKEGLTYSYPVTLKNVGIDTCRFKIKQPPPSTGLKVKYQPGPVAAGMSITFDVEIFAVAVGVESSAGVGQVSHCIEIVTETDFLYFPVNAAIMTLNGEGSPPANISREGPSKGTLILSDRPPSRETLTRPRKE